jgi:hypothetical protein
VTIGEQRLQIELSPIDGFVIARGVSGCSLSLGYINRAQWLVSPASVAQPGTGPTATSSGSGLAIGQHTGDITIGGGGRPSSDANLSGLDISQLPRPATFGITLYLPRGASVTIVSAGQMKASRKAGQALHIYDRR